MKLKRGMDLPPAPQYELGPDSSSDQLYPLEVKRSLSSSEKTLRDYVISSIINAPEYERSDAKE